MSDLDLAYAAEVVGTVVELSTAERDSYLETLDLDTGLRNEIDRMLTHRDQWQSMLLEPVASPNLAREADPNYWLGRRLGAHRIMGLIGEGGMGRVYLAERVDSEFDRRVAIKVVSSTVSAATLQRFTSERQMLAKLEHPAIARLYDGGTTPAGIPYLVMEYVDGLPIDRYCDHHHLGIEARLGLLLKICDAVAYAHRNLIVHRDLKPQNIFVTTEGDVKLLDFGIAEMIGSTSGENQRRRGSGPLTPSYASPEQILGQAVTTSSDVYSLGVIAYRLLAGISPYSGHRADRSELRNAIVERQPPVASRALESASPERRRLSSRSRAMSYGGLRRSLRGDLDAIIDQALRKRPEQRYTTVAGLADDLSRHLSNLPVQARGSSWNYRAAKFARRHWLGLALGSLSLLLLAGSTLALLRLSNRLARQRDLAQHQRLQADEINGILLDALGSPTIGRSSKDPLAGTVLSVEALRNRLGERQDPAMQAAYLHSLGEILLRLGRYDEALSHIERAVQIRTELYGAKSLETAESENVLATVLQKQTRHDEAERLFRKILTLRQRSLGSRHPDTAVALNNLGLVLWEEQDLDEAERYLQTALEIARSELGESHPGVLSVMSNLALVLHDRADIEQAEIAYRQALDLAHRLFGPDHPRYAIAANNLAMLLLYRDHGLDEAENLARRSLSIRARSLGPDHPSTAIALHNLAKVADRQADLVQAAALFGFALEVRRSALGSEHPDTEHSAELMQYVRLKIENYQLWTE